MSETRAQLFDFYRDIGQELRRWEAKPPRLPEVLETVSSVPTPDPPPSVAVDAASEVGNAIDVASRTSAGS